MHEKPRTASRLAEHNDALQSLLNALLAEVPAHTPPGAATGTGPPASGPPGSDADLDAGPPLSPTEAIDAEGPPQWARCPFRVLMCRIHGLHFAVPLLMLRAVVRLEKPPRPFPGQPAWHLGVVRHRQQTLLVADLGQLLGLGFECVAPAYLLVIGDGRVAIACERLGDTPMTDPGEVRWHRGGRERAWFAGLLVGRMSVLLDAGAVDRRIRHG